ncbi:hypothetical protein HDV06_006415 [Boothiomyces sp. JEL0866]|nr:hypothetical protein HDV06_006415 [Boothiomyces sp. JEL0866]
MQIYQNIEKKDYILKSLNQLIQSSHCPFEIKSNGYNDSSTSYETGYITVSYLVDPTADLYVANTKLQQALLLALVQDYVYTCPPNPTIFQFNLIQNIPKDSAKYNQLNIYAFNEYFDFGDDPHLYVNEYNLEILETKLKQRKTNLVLINIILFGIKLGYFHNINYLKDTLTSLFQLVLLLDFYLIVCFILHPNNYFLLVFLLVLINLFDEKKDYELIEKRMKPDGIYLFFILVSIYIDDSILFLQLLSFTINFIFEIVHGKLIRSLDERADYFIHLYRDYGLYLQIFINSLFIFQPFTISFYYNNAINLFLLLVNFIPILPNKNYNKFYLALLLIYFYPENKLISQKQIVDYNAQQSLVELVFTKYVDMNQVHLQYKSKEFRNNKLILETEFTNQLEIEPSRIVFPICSISCTFEFPYYEYSQFQFKNLGLNTINNTVQVQLHDHVIEYDKQGDEIEIRVSCKCPNELVDGYTIYTKKFIV